jgi:bacterioferritin-associated ferredoxin
MYACICRAISEDDVRRAGRRGVTTPDALITALGLRDKRCCGRCATNIHRFVTLAWEGAAETGPQPLVAAAALPHAARVPASTL